MPELLNNLHCKNAKDLCFKHRHNILQDYVFPPLPLSLFFQGLLRNGHMSPETSNDDSKADTHHSLFQPKQFVYHTNKKQLNF